MSGVSNQRESLDELTVAPQVLLRTLASRIAELTPEQAAYVEHRASLDFVVYNSVTKMPLLAIKVDGFAYYDNNAKQMARDDLKNAIVQSSNIPLLRLSTLGSAEPEQIRAALNEVLIRP